MHSQPLLMGNDPLPLGAGRTWTWEIGVHICVANKALPGGILWRVLEYSWWYRESETWTRNHVSYCGIQEPKSCSLPINMQKRQGIKGCLHQCTVNGCRPCRKKEITDPVQGSAAPNCWVVGWIQTKQIGLNYKQLKPRASTYRGQRSIPQVVRPDEETPQPIDVHVKVGWFCTKYHSVLDSQCVAI